MYKTTQLIQNTLASFTLLARLTSSAGLLLLLLTSGCAIQPPTSMMDVKAGDYFRLDQPITIRAEHARHFIQFGQLTGSGFNHHEPHCRIEIKTLRDTAVTIQQDDFKIIRVALDEERIAQNNNVVQLAQNSYLNNLTLSQTLNDANNHQAWYAQRSDNERPETMDIVHLYVYSERQKDVLRLTCSGSLSNGHPMDAPRSYRPQLQQINQILGVVGQIVPQSK